MSIKVMTRVWDKSPQKGSALLLVLAMADHANDHGVCWPAEQHLAKKTRLSKRQIVRLIDTLANKGEIYVVPPETPGRGHYTSYVVLSGLNEEQIASALHIGLQMDKDKAITESKRVTSCQKGDILTQKVTSDTQKGDIPKLKTALTVTEPSFKPSTDSAPDKPDAIPVPAGLLTSGDLGSGKKEVVPAPPVPPKINTEIKNAFALICHGTETAWNAKTLATAMMSAIKNVMALEPDVTAERITAFGNEWRKRDFRGQKGQKPKPHQVPQEWPTLMIAKKGSTNGQSTNPSTTADQPDTAEPAPRRFVFGKPADPA